MWHLIIDIVTVGLNNDFFLQFQPQTCSLSNVIFFSALKVQKWFLSRDEVLILWLYVSENTVETEFQRDKKKLKVSWTMEDVSCNFIYRVLKGGLVDS